MRSTVTVENVAPRGNADIMVTVPGTSTVTDISRLVGKARGGAVAATSVIMGKSAREEFVRSVSVPSMRTVQAIRPAATCLESGMSTARTDTRDTIITARQDTLVLKVSVLSCLLLGSPNEITFLLTGHGLSRNQRAILVCYSF